MTDNEALPARIILQVRDGVPNTLLEFEITTAINERPATDASIPGAKRHWDVGVLEIAAALFEAAKPLVAQSVENQSDDEKREKVRNWVRDVAEWVLS